MNEPKRTGMTTLKESLARYLDRLESSNPELAGKCKDMGCAICNGDADRKATLNAIGKKK